MHAAPADFTGLLEPRRRVHFSDPRPKGRNDDADPLLIRFEWKNHLDAELPRLRDGPGLFWQGQRTRQPQRYRNRRSRSNSERDVLHPRPTIGRACWLYDAWGKYGWGTTDHTKWFALWNASTGDSTYVGRVKRGHFRLHPMGPRRLSEGCITVTNPTTFDRLADFLRSSGADLPVPGSSFKAYGTVEVK